jgi:hypothetical protein
MLDGARQHELITEYYLGLSHYYLTVRYFLGAAFNILCSCSEWWKNKISNSLKKKWWCYTAKLNVHIRSVIYKYDLWLVSLIVYYMSWYWDPDWPPLTCDWSVLQCYFFPKYMKLSVQKVTCVPTYNYNLLCVPTLHCNLSLISLGKNPNRDLNGNPPWTSISCRLIL